MGFTLKTKEQLFGIKEFVNGNIPVISQKLENGVIAEANRDNTIFVNEEAPDALLKENLTLEEETEHILQMKRGNQYTDQHVIENTPSEFNVFKRSGGKMIPITNKASSHNKQMNEGDPNAPWEAEAKYNAKNNTNGVQDMVS
jgi:hypothetical protein